MAEKARRYSRKREAIREVLMGTESHPNAEWIFNQLKPQIPDLSLATVYRNLSEMKQNGEVQSVAFWDGKERFDGNVKKHSHFVCENAVRLMIFILSHMIQRLTNLLSLTMTGKWISTLLFSTADAEIASQNKVSNAKAFI